ncbi:sugar transporter SWEET1 [Vanessa atalanta]|uniref:sugar transporter SWEET1 n=1 Tax=Vanessa atalanta TaxID=42275 RepID=UPI001FCCF064|nr:sugar transporter SWEET1 [Vanessa atalanta]XP_047528288.1 sugar transporter SWEET1 [Vanessa atalanta]
MEALGDILLPYKEPVALVTRIVTMGQMFSGSFLCYDIYKQGNTKGIPIMPFLGGLIMGILNLKFGFILRDDTMIQVNFFGLSLSILYIMIYYTYATEKGQVWLQMGIAGAFSAALIGYAEMEDPKLIENRFGSIITVFMFYLIASPLLNLKHIVKNKSTEGMPFPIIFSGTIVTFMWLLYGIILKNKFLVLQNVVAFALCGFQLSLFAIYPSKPKSKDKVKAKAKKTN